MYLHAVSATRLSFYCWSGVNSTVNTPSLLWKAIYSRNKCSCNPILMLYWPKTSCISHRTMTNRKAGEGNAASSGIIGDNIKRWFNKSTHQVYLEYQIRVTVTNSPFTLSLWLDEPFPAVIYCWSGLFRGLCNYRLGGVLGLRCSLNDLSGWALRAKRGELRLPSWRAAAHQ